VKRGPVTGVVTRGCVLVSSLNGASFENDHFKVVRGQRRWRNKSLGAFGGPYRWKKARLLMFCERWVRFGEVG